MKLNVILNPSPKAWGANATAADAERYLRAVESDLVSRWQGEAEVCVRYQTMPASSPVTVCHSDRHPLTHAVSAWLTETLPGIVAQSDADKRKQEGQSSRYRMAPPSYELKPSGSLLSTRCYVHLFHGRLDPNANLEGWGFDGPIIGPCTFQFTYTTMRIFSTNPNHGESGEIELPLDGDCVLFDGALYGDFSICTGLDLVTAGTRKRPILTVEEAFKIQKSRGEDAL